MMKTPFLLKMQQVMTIHDFLKNYYLHALFISRPTKMTAVFQ